MLKRKNKERKKTSDTIEIHLVLICILNVIQKKITTPKVIQNLGIWQSGDAGGAKNQILNHFRYIFFHKIEEFQNSKDLFGITVTNYRNQQYFCQCWNSTF